MYDQIQDHHKFQKTTARARPTMRRFSVARKGSGFLEVEADTIQFHESGGLIFRNGNDLVIAFSPTGWSYVEEGDDD